MNAIQTAIVESLTNGTLAAFIAKALGDSKQKTKINKAIKEFLAGDADAKEEKPAKAPKGKKAKEEKPAKAELKKKDTKSKAAPKKGKPAKTDTEDEEVPLEKKTVKELKDMCKEKKLATTGKKEELIERLRGETDAPVEDDGESADYKKMKVPELKALCKERGLDDKGKKDELIERLEEADTNAGSDGSDKEDDGEGKDESAAEKEEEQEDDE